MTSEIDAIFSFAVICILFVVVLFLVFNVIGEILRENNDKIEQERIKNEYNKKEVKDMAAVQTIVYNRSTPKKTSTQKVKGDFNVDFNISLKNAVVKTEVVYAE